MNKLIKKIKIRSTITVITGLHIGANSENVEIGGIDNPVIKLSSKDNQPYIPGSSIKGKMRCLLEQAAGASVVGGDETVNKLFGITEKKELKTSDQPSRIIVRDAMLDEKSANEMKSRPNMDMPYTEGKWENVIHRVMGKAEHPRLTERVPAGAVFNSEMVINIWDDDNEEEMLKLLGKGIRLLENDYLGGNGSRGYGQIKFGNMTFTELCAANDWKDETPKDFKFD